MGSPGLPSRGCSCTLARSASECVNHPSSHTAPQRPAQKQEANKENTNTRPAPFPFPPRLQEFCLRQSPPATFIEAAESRDHQPLPTLVSQTLSSKGREQRKRRLPGTTSPQERQDRLREEPTCIAKSVQPERLLAGHAEVEEAQPSRPDSGVASIPASLGAKKDLLKRVRTVRRILRIHSCPAESEDTP